MRNKKKQRKGKRACGCTSAATGAWSDIQPITRISVQCKKHGWQHFIGEQ